MHTLTFSYLSFSNCSLKNKFTDTHTEWNIVLAHLMPFTSLLAWWQGFRTPRRTAEAFKGRDCSRNTSCGSCLHIFFKSSIFSGCIGSPGADMTFDLLGYPGTLLHTDIFANKDKGNRSCHLQAGISLIFDLLQDMPLGMLVGICSFQKQKSGKSTLNLYLEHSPI